jgi:nucleoside-diphosphate-sugar epimerase
MSTPHILVTGALGQIGSELLPALQNKYTPESVIAVDISQPPKDLNVKFEHIDCTDVTSLEKCIQKYSIITIYHLASLLSASGEKDPQRAWAVNIGGLKSVLDLAVKYHLTVFWPSSMAAFGPTTPKDCTPQNTVMQPTTMYGVTKVAGELLCQYYHQKYQLDVRSLRYPGIISWKTEPGGGTTDYANYMFFSAIKHQPYTCFLSENTQLPMMYMDDAIKATLDLMSAPAEQLTIWTSYNLAAFSFTPKQLLAEINLHTPLTVTYVPDFRQVIADSWPHSIDDSVAKRDWGWSPDYDFPKFVSTMLHFLKKT